MMWYQQAFRHILPTDVDHKLSPGVDRHSAETENNSHIGLETTF